MLNYTLFLVKKIKEGCANSSGKNINMSVYKQKNPLYIFTLILLFSLALSLQLLPSKSFAAPKSIGPKYFIAERLGQACTIDSQGKPRSQGSAKRAFDNLFRNHQTYVTKLRQSTSLVVNKDAYSANWKPILFNSYAAAAANDATLAKTILDGLSQLATANYYSNEKGLISRKVALRVRCYENGPNSPCPSHTPRFVARMYSNLLISAAVLQSFMTDQDRKTILPWLKTGYRKFVLPEVSSDQDGIYDFANNGMAQLAYAALAGDKALARRELSTRKKQFNKAFQTSGYIRNNSYRGVRALWYHTYGLDPALSYALVAREWGQDFFKDAQLGPKLKAAVQKTALGVIDYTAFRSVGNRGNSFSTNEKDSKAHIHQYALNIPLISKKEFGFNLPLDSRYKKLRKLESYSQTSGLIAKCYYSGK